MNSTAPRLHVTLFLSWLFQPLILLAQTPPRPANGPWNSDIAVYSVSVVGHAERLAIFPRAGVSTLARLWDGRLIAAFQHFPEHDPDHFDRVAVAFSSDEGQSWTQPQPIRVRGMESGLMRPFDPTLVPLPDGRIRIYFTSNRGQDFRTSRPEIYSAISQDGVEYTFEPGVRFGIEGRPVIDCAVALHDGMFHLYAPDNGSTEEFVAQERDRRPPAAQRSGYHAISRDGLTFTRVDDVSLTRSGNWLGAALSQEQTLLFFGTGGPGGLWIGESRDGTTWASGGLLRVPGADPGVVPGKNGGWIVTVTSRAALR